MGDIRAVYRSSDPRHLAALEAVQAANVAAQPARDAFRAEFPGVELYGHDGVINCVYFPARHADTHETLTSYGWGTPVDPNYPDLTIWKKASSRSVDHRRYALRAKGKGVAEMAERLRAMSAPERATFVGVPSYVPQWPFSRPGYRLVGDTVWMIWSQSPEYIELSEEFDGSIWERMKLSDYHLMLESLPPEEASYG